QKLGDAFLAQQADVMDSVQRLRWEAYNAGRLRSSPQQIVSIQGSEIIIQPANPSVVYVPYYDPSVVYGAWAYPDYPPYYFAPRPHLSRPRQPAAFRARQYRLARSEPHHAWGNQPRRFCADATGHHDSAWLRDPTLPGSGQSADERRTGDSRSDRPARRDAAGA